MSLGRLGAMCGCSTGQECADCQARTPGLGAQWAHPTNYDPTLHRRYAGMGAAVPIAQTNALIYQRPQAPGMGEITLGDSGWTLGDLASAALIVLAVIAIRKEWK